MMNDRQLYEKVIQMRFRTLERMIEEDVPWEVLRDAIRNAAIPYWKWRIKKFFSRDYRSILRDDTNR